MGSLDLNEPRSVAQMIAATARLYGAFPLLFPTLALAVEGPYLLTVLAITGHGPLGARHVGFAKLVDDRALSRWFSHTVDGEALFTLFYMRKTAVAFRASAQTLQQLDQLAEYYRRRFVFNPPVTKTAILALAVRRLAEHDLTGDQAAYDAPVRASDASA